MELAINTLENNSPVTQKLFLNKTASILGVRIHLLKVGVLTDGKLQLRIKINSSTVLEIEKNFTELNQLGNYWHGLFAFPLASPLPINVLPKNGSTLIELEFKMFDHTNSNSNYVALVHSADPTTKIKHNETLDYYSSYGTSPSNDIWNNPYGIEVYTI